MAEMDRGGRGLSVGIVIMKIDDSTIFRRATSFLAGSIDKFSSFLVRKRLREAGNGTNG